jgi:CheY-like chemotaxis protein
MQTIVVIDDEFSLADVLAATLADCGYVVHSVTNGAHGLKAIREHRPDLVLLDVMMPLLDGAGMLAAMHGDPSIAATPVIIMSSLPEPAVRARCKRYVAFLRKPFSFECLLEAVTATLSARPGDTGPP